MPADSGAPQAIGRVRFRNASELAEAERHEHEARLRVAIDEAVRTGRAFSAAIFDRSGKLLSVGVNPGKHSHVLHSEIVAIQRAAEVLGERELRECKLYVTGAPCPMCATAIVWSCIDLVVWGTSISALTQMGFGQFGISCQDIAASAPSTADPMEMIEGVLADETDRLFLQAPTSTWRKTG